MAAFPDYHIETPHLGEGTFKVAYKCEYNDKPAVLKILKQEIVEDVDSPEGISLPERFARELLGMGRINSKHVVQALKEPEVSEIGSSRRLWYLEPFYPGGTLDEAIAKGKHGLHLGDQVLAALLTAISNLWSQAKIVHRDIKPGNIVFDDSDNLVLLDLGIAFFGDLTELTASEQSSPKTPLYAAPEQFEMRRLATIDFRTDLFQAGLVAYEAYTGKHPYFRQFTLLGEYLQRIQAVDFDESAIRVAGCDEKRLSVLKRLLASTPSRRYRTVDLALAAVREAIQ
ncbi:serine/threonine-protein kinase [Kineococcus arenarius]|uniref:serine/threonine-protein kinase n=1 Tax=unclassified Kineococcus TaxID=2621656 RepID=UPI003D7E069D